LAVLDFWAYCAASLLVVLSCPFWEFGGGVGGSYCSDSTLVTQEMFTVELALGISVSLAICLETRLMQKMDFSDSANLITQLPPILEAKASRY
jgi:hypothetical protein